MLDSKQQDRNMEVAEIKLLSGIAGYRQTDHLKNNTLTVWEKWEEVHFFDFISTNQKGEKKDEQF